MATPTAPLRLLRNANAYRTIGAGLGVRIGVGFLVKSGRTVDFPWARLPHYSAVWCLRGGGSYMDEQRHVHVLRPGSLFHRFHDRPHGNTIEPGSHWAEAFFCLPNAVATALMQMGAIDPRRPVSEPGIDLAMLDDLDALREELTRAGESELPRLMNRITGMLIDLLTREDGRGDAPRRRLIDEACRRLADDPRCDLERLADDLGFSYERFRKVFRDTTGVAPAAYRIRRRIDRARRLLVGGTQPLAAIAEELGYPNQFAFSAQFKRLVGESPEAYRRRH
jgi:AraC-like DNA-binding protein